MIVLYPASIGLILSSIDFASLKFGLQIATKSPRYFIINNVIFKSFDTGWPKSKASKVEHI